MTMQPLLISKLILRFISHCIMSGVNTALIILQPKKPPAGLLRFTFNPMSERGAALLGAMVTLTPGSSVIDINMDTREMILHLLNLNTASTTIDAIRRDFEHDIARLFPAEVAK